MDDSSPKLALVVDASSNPLYLGIPNHTGWEKIVSDPGQTMDGLFRALEELFKGRIDKLNSVDVIYFCCGPGSTLGLRLAAAFVKTILWEGKGKVSHFQYNALDLASSLIDEKETSIQAPFRMGKRFMRTGKPRSIGKKEILAEEVALKEYPESLHLLGPRQLSIEIPEEKILPYQLEKIGGIEELSLISEPAKQPVPYSPQPATFTKWKGYIPAKN